MPSKTVDPEYGVGYGYLGFIIFIKVLGLLSMVASTFILRDVYRKLRKVSASTHGLSWRTKVSLTQSVLFCLSVGDFFSSFFVQFLSTWMVPSSAPVEMANGSVTSCTVQAYFGYLFYGLSAFSNASLAASYCLIVKFGWKDNDKDRHRLAFTIIPFVCAMIISIAPLPGQNYNYNGSFFCDITASPLGCNYPESTTTCIRGADARDMLLYVGIIPFMVAFFIIIVAVVLLIDAVVKQERRMDRYLQEGAPLNRTLTKQTTRQGLYYIAAFGLAWIPWYIYAFLEYYQQRIPEALAVFHYTTMPLQGVFNALVYFRPKYKSDRTNNPTESRTSSVLRVLKISLPTVNCCCKSISQQKSNETMEGTYMHRTEENKAEEKKNGDVVGDEEANENSNDIEQKEGDKELEEVGSG